jgi:hypothetical protein
MQGPDVALLPHKDIVVASDEVLLQQRHLHDADKIPGNQFVHIDARRHLGAIIPPRVPDHRVRPGSRLPIDQGADSLGQHGVHIKFLSAGARKIEILNWLTVQQFLPAGLGVPAAIPSPTNDVPSPRCCSPSEILIWCPMSSQP